MSQREIGRFPPDVVQRVVHSWLVAVGLPTDENTVALTVSTMSIVALMAQAGPPPDLVPEVPDARPPEPRSAQYRAKRDPFWRGR